jgi:hypothetical protein
MASCPGERKNPVRPCLSMLCRCKKCGNVGCDQSIVGACSNQAFRFGKCSKCGAQGQKEIFT